MGPQASAMGQVAKSTYKSASVGVSARARRFRFSVFSFRFSVPASMPLRCRSMPLDPTSRRDRFFDNKMPHDVLSSNRSVLTHVELKERLNSMRIVDADLSKAHSSPNERLELGRRDFAQTLESCDFSVANSFHGIVTFSF